MPTLDELRERWMLPTPPGEVHLNAGTLSPTPRPVFDAVELLRREQATSPSEFFFFRMHELLGTARQSLAKFVRAKPNGLFLQPNVTTSLNLAMRSVPLKPGDEILTTDHEYGAMSLLLDAVARDRGATVKRVKIPMPVESPDEIVDAIRRGITKRTRVLFFCHVTSATALLFPVTSLCDLAREHGLYSVVDGAHAPGMVPLDLNKLGADAYGANCHKWMMAPCGAGFLHASKRLKAVLEPLVVSWGDEKFDRRKPDRTKWKGTSALQYRVEYHGVYDRTPQMVIPEAIGVMSQLDRVDREGEAPAEPRRMRVSMSSSRASAGLAGASPSRMRVAMLRAHASEAFESIGLKCVSPRDERLWGAMTVFALKPAQADTLARHLWPKKRALVPVTQHAGRRYLRVSTAWFNTPNEIDEATRRVAELLAGRRGG
jgi:isopenicillin-N epimerase